MRYSLILMLLAACTPQAVEVGECTLHSDCELPMEFAIQSNCPFAAACIEGSCEVVCPQYYHDPNPEVSRSYPVACMVDSECDCSERGNRSSGCVCLDGACVSVEG